MINKASLFLCKAGLPLISKEGKLLINKNNKIKEASDGNGGTYCSLRKSGCLADMKSRGIKWIFIGSVDNALLKMVDITLLGMAIKQGVQIASKSVVKANPQERVGVFCKMNGHPKVIEYTELPEKMAGEVDENGELKYGESHIMCNLYTIDAIEKVSKEHLMYHCALKKNSYIDENGKEIIPEEIINGHEGDEYNTETKEISGYDLVEVPKNKDGIMTKDTTTVIYEYIRPAKVIVNYIDIDTNKELASAVTINGHQEEKYETEEKDIKFYKLVEERRPVNATGKMNVEVTKDENGNEIVNDTTYVNYYYRKLNFNLSIDKKVNNIVVNGKALNINGKLGKVEIAKKDISTSKIEISYIIKVTNKGELAGKATILENIPFGTTMTKEQNPMWNIANTVATLDTDEIKPGETREYEVILVWNNNEDNIGTKLNEVEILSNENEPGFEDSNKDDDKDKAEVIISISTGGATHIAIAGVILVILAGTVVVLVKKTKEE